LLRSIGLLSVKLKPLKVLLSMKTCGNMKKIMLFFLLGISLFAFPIFSHADSIKLGCDYRYWYPFTYEEKKIAKGMHVDIVRKALETLGYQIKIVSLPRKRCIISAQNGDIDGIISIAFHPELVKFLAFPEDVTQTKESSGRIMQIDQVVVTYIDNPYEFEGDIRSLPIPVRIPRGESLMADLGKTGLKVEETNSDKQNFGKLIRDKIGVVITSSMIAENMELDPVFKGKFKINSKPLVSESYHLAFSAKTRLTATEKASIWREIEKWRNDYVFMQQVYSQY
jgi:polar amino acid transport system substrate-binding protein